MTSYEEKVRALDAVRADLKTEEGRLAESEEARG